MTAVADILDSAADYWAWRAVPDRVALLVKEGKTIKQQVKDAVKDLDRDDYGIVFWQPETKAIHIMGGDMWDNEMAETWIKALEAVPGVDTVAYASEGKPGRDAGYIKISASPTSSPQALEWIGKPHAAAQTMMGGPNPLTSTIVSGLLGAGVGYGGGWLMEKLFPEKYVKPGRMRRNMAIAGGLGFAALPAWRASAAMRNQGPSGLIQQDAAKVSPADVYRRFFPNKPTVANPTTSSVGSHTQASALAPEFKAAAEKLAFSMGRQNAGSMLAESIPVDAFNNVVWQDARPGAARDNPMGTKNPFGNNEQRMFSPTSPAVAALASGMVSGVGSAKRKSMISPMDVAKGLVSAGIGLASARAFGGLAGAFFGVTPAARSKLQDLGALGGLMTPIVGGMFR